jgi:hypothetical protein
MWPILVIIASGLAVAAATFLVWKEFTIRAFSSRLFWVGIGMIVLGGITAISAASSYSTLGTPSIHTAGSDARIAHERIGETMKANLGRYAFSTRMFVSGISCIAISAAIEILTR